MSDETKEVKNSEFAVTKDGKEILLKIRHPTPAESTESNKIWSKTWSEALKAGNPIRVEVDKLLKDRGIWTEENEKELVQVAKDLETIGWQLTQEASFYDSLEAAKEDALLAREKRNRYYELSMIKGSLDGNTAEGQADIARLNYLISVCTVYNNSRGNPYYKDLADYTSKVDDEVTAVAAKKYMEVVVGVDYDFEKEHPENKFLIKYKLMNDKLHLLNQDGKTVDSEGNLINDLGQRVDENGNLVNFNGRPIDKDGKYIGLEPKPFNV